MEAAQQQPAHCAAAGATSAITSASPSAAPPAAASSSSWPLGMLEPPRVLANGVEVSVHACTRSMAREIKYIFPHLRPRVHTAHSKGPAGGAAAGAVAAKGEAVAGGEDEVLIVPTIQKSRVDTVRFGAEVEEEKDRCLEYVRACLPA
jgi:hypothetical protein